MLIGRLIEINYFEEVQHYLELSLSDTVSYHFGSFHVSDSYLYQEPFYNFNHQKRNGYELRWSSPTVT